MIISIHQPNFMPWNPFFEKIQQSDVFVCLTQCQFEKNGYQNRFNFNDKWYTMSVKKGLKPILDKVYINPKNNWDRIKNSLSEYKSILKELDKCIGESLVATNFCIISNLIDMLNIDTKLKIDYPTELTSTERLVDICVKYGATTYLSGIGAKEYLNESLFEEKGINVEYQKVIDKSSILDIL